MQISPEDAIAQENHDGRTFFSCSEGCHQRFLADPQTQPGDAAHLCRRARSLARRILAARQTAMTEASPLKATRMAVPWLGGSARASLNEPVATTATSTSTQNDRCARRADD